MDTLPSESLVRLLIQYLGLSENGIAILDKNDRFVFHNQTFANMFGFAETSMIGRSRDDMMIWMYSNHRGANIEWPDLESWLKYVRSQHRNSPFRSFEVDLIDGRWLLVTEQVFPGGELFLHSTDVTKQKQIELALRDTQAELERQALTDELTGIPNRRHFMQLLGQEIARSRRYNHPLSLAMLDIDHFKNVNDRYGHPAGDEVLRHFATFLRSGLRTGDVVGRLGGEEFAILLPETNLDNALHLVRRINVSLRKKQFDEIVQGFSYTFSGGVAHLPEDKSADSSWLLAASDKAMYQAKTTGRNRVVGYGQT